MEKVMVERFVAEDGKVFEDEKSCLDYEATLENTYYYMICYAGDLVEGQSGPRPMYFVVIQGGEEAYDEDEGLGIVRWLCERVFGYQVDFVGGKFGLYNWMHRWTIEKVKTLSRLDNLSPLCVLRDTGYMVFENKFGVGKVLRDIYGQGPSEFEIPEVCKRNL